MCTSTGRKCEYRYIIDKRTKAYRLVQPGQVDLTFDERYYLDFFRNVTSSQCAGYFYDEFWQRLVHQASEDQPAVRHAVIGMGALNHSFVQLRIGQNEGPLDLSFSLHQIAKAITSLQKNLKDENLGHLRVEIALIACVVIASTVIFQEDPQAAGQHLHSGYKLLEFYMVNHSGDESFGSALSAALGSAHLLWSTFHNPECFANQQDRNFLFVSLERVSYPASDHAKTMGFLVILSRLIIQKFPGRFSVGPASQELESEIVTVFSKLRVWQAQIKQYYARHMDDHKQENMVIFTLLEAWGEILHIMIIVEKGTLPREARYDSFLEKFQRTLSLIQDLSAKDIPPSHITTAIVPLLLFCAIKCRDTLARERAFPMLRQWRFHEGVQRDDEMTTVVKRVIDIESQELIPGSVISETSRIEALYVEMPRNERGVHLWVLSCRASRKLAKRMVAL